jgi:hypothetical protein
MNHRRRTRSYPPFCRARPFMTAVNHRLTMFWRNMIRPKREGLKRRRRPCRRVARGLKRAKYAQPGNSSAPRLKGRTFPDYQNHAKGIPLQFDAESPSSQRPTETSPRICSGRATCHPKPSWLMACGSNIRGASSRPPHTAAIHEGSSRHASEDS